MGTRKHTRRGDGDLVGQTIARKYRVIRLLGQGGMGAVYEVVHVGLGRNFAMKRLAPELAEDAEALARFRREAEVIARFRHPNIVEVSDWETLDDGTPCMFMELLRGEDLAQRLRRDGALPWPTIAHITDQVLAALAAAHRAGVVHRDLKPHNIFLSRDDTDEERVKLLDFGLSKIQRQDQSITRTGGGLLGTPLYMSPEQAEGDARVLGPETDVWALGAILVEMATGQPAFAATTTPSVLYRICHGLPVSIVEHRPDAPPDFVDAVGRALRRDPLDRTSIEELRQDVREALREVEFDATVTHRELLDVDTAELTTIRPELIGGFDPPTLVTSTDVGVSTLSRASGQQQRAPEVAREAETHAQEATEPRMRAAWFIAGGAAISLAIVGWVRLRGGGESRTSHASAALIFESDPAGAVVAVDGWAQGYTPVRFPTTPGARHEVAIKLAGHKVWQQVILVGSDGGDVAYKATLERLNELRVECSTGHAEILVRGAKMATTPATLEVDPGVTSVELQSEHGYDSYAVTWSADGTSDVIADCAATPPPVVEPVVPEPPVAPKPAVKTKPRPKAKKPKAKPKPKPAPRAKPTTVKPRAVQVEDDEIPGALKRDSKP